MNWLKKGPELKLSELKVPGFLYDLCYDLKERHLLPLVALLIVAIIARADLLRELDRVRIRNRGDADHRDRILGGRGWRKPRRRTLDPGPARLPPSAEGRPRPRPVHGPGRRSKPKPKPEVERRRSGNDAGRRRNEATVIGGESDRRAETGDAVDRQRWIVFRQRIGSPSGSDSVQTQTRYANDSIDVRIVTVPPSSSRTEDEEGEAEGAKSAATCPN